VSAKERHQYDLPVLKLDPVDHEGLTFNASAWLGRIGKTEDAPYIRCRVRLGDTEFGYDDPCWVIRVERRRIRSDGRRVVQRAFEATIGFYPDGFRSAAASADVVLRGTCRNWEEAIDALSYAPLATCIRKLAKEQYKGRWIPIRPFDVTYPWRSANEPNAKYSPFRFKGATFSVETEGAVGSTLDHDIDNARRYARGLDANAFLWGPINGEYRLYHRDSMHHYDVIPLEEWYARIVAGTGD